ncbi:MAG: hypothetical protein ACREDT_16970 [Methylocella sp.]
MRIDAGIIAELRRRVAAGEVKELVEPVIRSGTAVLITAGALEGLPGACTAITGDRRADMLIDLLGRMVHVKIASDHLVAID